MTVHISGLELFSVVERARVKKAVREVVKSACLGDAQLSLTFIDDVDMRALNRQWRGKNQPTDVLSFAAWEGEEAFVGIDDVLGDLVIAVGVAHKQARAVGHSVEVEVAVLVAHGLLHLLGLDHERSLAEARHQAECEMTFLAGAGYDPTAGLIGRAV